MKEEVTDQKSGIWFLLVLLLFIPIGLLFNKLVKEPALNRAKNHPTIVTARIVHLSKNRGNNYFDFEFDYKGVHYEGGGQLHISARNVFKWRYVPVIFETEDPDNSYLLLGPKEFEKFGLPFPDSLNWVKEYVYEPWV